MLQLYFSKQGQVCAVVDGLGAAGRHGRRMCVARGVGIFTGRHAGAAVSALAVPAGFPSAAAAARAAALFAPALGAGVFACPALLMNRRSHELRVSSGRFPPSSPL